MLFFSRSYTILKASYGSSVPWRPHGIAYEGPYACVGIGDIAALEPTRRVTCALGLRAEGRRTHQSMSTR